MRAGVLTCRKNISPQKLPCTDAFSVENTFLLCRIPRGLADGHIRLLQLSSQQKVVGHRVEGHRAARAGLLAALDEGGDSTPSVRPQGMGKSWGICGSGQ